MDELHHECGIAAIYHLPGVGSDLAPLQGPEQVSRLMPRLLLDLQNRGQLAAGLASFDPDREKLLDTYKQIGTVIEAFRLNHQAKYESIMQEFAGRAAIGHVRYATCGATDRSYAQPFERHHGCKWKWFAFAFNGQLANFAELRDELLTQTDYHLTRNIDTEVIMHYLSHELSQCGDDRPDLAKVFRNLSRKFDGAYNLVFLNAMGDMVVLRDPKGFRPLCYAQDGNLFAAASESVALLNLGFKDVHSLEPGEMILMQDGEIRHERSRPEGNAVALLLRVDLLRQRGQHARRPQRLPDAGGVGPGTGPAGTVAGKGPAGRRHDRRSGAGHRQGRRRRHGLRAGRAVGRRADPQPLHRPHLHRGPEPSRARAAEVHAAARSACTASACC